MIGMLKELCTNAVLVVFIVIWGIIEGYGNWKRERDARRTAARLDQ